MKTLNQRRKEMCLKFAKNCLKNEKVRSIFPVNNQSKRTRNTEQYRVNFAKTKRYANSTVPSLQRLLNTDEQQKKIALRKYGR